MTDQVDRLRDHSLVVIGEADERRGHVLLLAAVVASVAVQGTVPPSSVQQIVVAILVGASLVLAFRIARSSRPMTTLALALAVTGVAVATARALGAPVGDGEARVLNAVLVALGPPAIALGVIRNLRVHQAVRIEAVMGVLSLYMLIGMAFAFLFGAVDRLGGAPFFADGTDASTATCLYYSFTTLATVGYGDLTARSDFGHTLSIFEALMGQIYLVTVVSLIVGNLGRRAGAIGPLPRKGGSR
jgi:hypothetical protein